jgi:hypothetical protein
MDFAKAIGEPSALPELSSLELADGMTLRKSSRDHGASSAVRCPKGTPPPAVALSIPKWDGR